MNISVPVKILCIIEKFTPERGGAESYTYDLACFLLQAGHEVEVLTSQSSVSDFKGTITLCKSLRFPRSYRNIFFNIAQKKKLKEANYDVSIAFWKTEGADVYFTHGGVEQMFLSGNFSSVSGMYKYFLILKRLLNLRHYWWLHLQRHILHNSKVICISKMIEEDIRTLYPKAAQNLVTIPNGAKFANEIDIPVDKNALRSELGLPEEATKILLFIGHDFRRKGLYTTLDAMKYLPEEYHIVVVGAGREVEAKRHARARNISDRVHIKGHVSNISKVLLASDVLVHPAWYEPFGLVVLEALSYGLPVITTHSTGAKMFLDESIGSVVKAGDARGIAEHVEKRVTGYNPEVRDMCIAASRRYPKEKSYSDILSLLTSIAEEKKLKH